MCNFLMHIIVSNVQHFFEQVVFALHRSTVGGSRSIEYLIFNMRVISLIVFFEQR